MTAGASGGTLSLSSKVNDAVANYAISASVTNYDPGRFTPPSFGATPSGSTLTGGANGAGGTGATVSLATPMPTFNFYDVMGNLTKVAQGGQQRTFVYDGLGRLASATTPEGGTVGFTYTDYDQVATRTDARGVVTNYSYDSLNRLDEVSYTVGSTGVTAAATVEYSYGTSVSSNNKGRLVSVSNGFASDTFTYDSLGRVTAVAKVINSATYNLSYAYNDAGQLTSITYPSGRVVTQTMDAIGRLEKVTSSSVDYLKVTDFTAAHAVHTATLGNGVGATDG